MKKTILILALFGLGGGAALAADQPSDQPTVRGSQIMTQQERAEHRVKMRSAKSREERERIRREHHEEMKKRAKERGAKIPDNPPAQRGGMGPGRMNGGAGMGPGGGMGPRGDGY